MKKALIIRYGAYGDGLIITPAVRRLKEMGYYTLLRGSDRVQEVFENNPYLDEFILHDKNMPREDLPEHWKELKKTVGPEDKWVNFCESIECNVALHPINPAYNYPKKERFELCNKSYYDETERWAGLEGCQKLPELYFKPEELVAAKSYLQNFPSGTINILWQLSGSGRQKVYPWTDYVVGELLKNYENIHIITTGDERCQLLESVEDIQITNLSGRIKARIAMCLTQFVDLVISPDTGVLHASGCYETPKIGLLGHTTRTNITKYFINDYSLEAECACAPCFRLIYDHEIQCPRDFVTGAAWCMSEGLSPTRLYDQILKVIGHKFIKRNQKVYEKNSIVQKV